MIYHNHICNIHIFIICYNKVIHTNAINMTQISVEQQFS